MKRVGDVEAGEQKGKCGFDMAFCGSRDGAER